MQWILVVLQFLGLVVGVDRPPQCYVVDARGTRIEITVSVDRQHGMFYTVLPESAISNQLVCRGFQATTIQPVTDLDPEEHIVRPHHGK